MALRQQLRILQKFINSFDFVNMKPDSSLIKSGAPEKGSVRALAQPGKAWAIYIKGGTQTTLTLEMPAGKYRVEWLNTQTGKLDKREQINHPSGQLALGSPPYVEDIAVRLLRR